MRDSVTNVIDKEIFYLLLIEKRKFYFYLVDLPKIILCLLFFIFQNRKIIGFSC
jgi:hypothetical protein